MNGAGFEFSAFDTLLQTDPSPLLIGGQAVNLWATVFLNESEELRTKGPFLSRDCDLFGTAELLVRLAQNTGWKATFSPKGQASPVIGYLTHNDSIRGELVADVLHSVIGLVPKDLQKQVRVDIGARTYITLSPVTLLKAKLVNCIELPRTHPEEKRKDVAHVKILIPCVAAYLRQALQKVIAGKFTERSCVDLLEETLSIISSDYGMEVARREKLDLGCCFPQAVKSCELMKIKNFAQHRL